MHKRPFRLMTVLAASALALSACGGDDGGGDDNADAGGGDGGNGGGDSITVGIKYDQPGLGLMEGDSPTGFDVDVARHVASELGYEEDQIEWMEAPTPQRETLLETGQVDFIAATYSINEERKERVDFAGPYFVAGQDLLVRADDDSINGPQDMQGKNLCSVAGSTPAANMQEDYPDVQLQEYDTYSLCVEALASGAVDALTTDDTILAGYAAQEQWAGQFRVVGETFSEELYGIGVPQGAETCQEINEILSTMLEDGTMDQIIEDHFGPADYTPNAEANPPEVGGHCSS